MTIQKNILLITTGGTIAGEVATDKKDADAIIHSEHYTDQLKSTLTSIRNSWGIEVNIVQEAICQIDSSDILPSHWTKMSSLIKDKYDNFDAFVITHGTNTLGYTCAALTFALANINKPVILTGSQVPMGMPGTDAVTNLSNAIRVAVWEREETPIKGVICVFGSYIITGCRVKKTTEFDYDAFQSFETNPLGRIGRIIEVNEANLKRHVGYLSTDTYPTARNADALICQNEFDTRIASLTEFPGMSKDIFQTLVENHGLQGFILRAFGAGDVSNHMREAFEYLKGMKIPIVITTQAPYGNSNFQVNEPGQFLKVNELAIPAYDMSIEAQTTKLAWLLYKKNSQPDYKYEQLCRDMVHDLRGEVNVLWEIGL